MRHAVILAGGVGERFWPLSRRDRPKQYLPLGGKLSLIRETVLRVLPLVDPSRVWVVTSADQLSHVRREVPEIPSRQILAEPEGKNTAPAIYWASLAISAKDPEATMLVTPSDAWVPKAAAYRQTLRQALRLAEKEPRLVLLGVQPTRVETGYGYIQPGAPIANSSAHEVRRFLEKPNLARARRFFRGKKHLWNCGIFVWQAQAFRAAAEAHLPEMVRAFRFVETKPRHKSVVEKAYKSTPRISVDVGILEPAQNVAVVPASFVWDDLGSWRALERLGKKGEYEEGDVIRVDAPGSIVWSENGLTAVVGVPDVIVVHTDDATLVVHKDRAQEVREVVDQLKSKKAWQGYLAQKRKK